MLLRRCASQMRHCSSQAKVETANIPLKSKLVLISNRNRNMNYFIAFTKCDAAATTKEICFYSLAKGREMLLE